MREFTATLFGCALKNSQLSVESSLASLQDLEGRRYLKVVVASAKYILTLTIKLSACPKSSSLLNNLFYLGEGVSFCILLIIKRTQIICS